MMEASGRSLQALNPSQLATDNERKHVSYYMHLRGLIRSHVSRGNIEPELGESKKPMGAYNWQPADAFVRGLESSGEERIIEGEGADPLLEAEDLEENLDSLSS
jgi:hypothetical protein